MKAGDRFKNWVEGLSQAWKDRLRGWMVSWVKKGTIETLESFEPGIIEFTRETLTKVKDTPDIPPEMRNLIDRALTTGSPPDVIAGWMMTVIGIIPQLLGLGAPLGRGWEYLQDRVIKSARFDPISVITAWRRDPEKYKKYLDDLKDLGWSDGRIETLKFITEIIPGVQDLIRMSVREAFSPEIAEKFGQYQDPPVLVYPWAEKLGLSKEWVDRYWAAHWELPSAGQGFEMLHRGVITEDELKLLLRALDVMPFWREKLIDISWGVPTRVDVRRFWDMRTIDEARLREVYTAIGYHGKDLEDYVLWTKIYVDFPDLLARYKNGWITLDQVKSELVAMGMKPERADTMIEEKIKKAAPERVAKERDLTAAEIIKGVKKEVISWDEGLELLTDMGYDRDEAAFKLAIEVAAMAGSPESYAEFKDLTQKYKLATGVEAKAMPEELKQAAAEVVKLAKEAESLKRSIEEEKRGLLSEGLLPEETTKRLKKLQVSLHQAESKLFTAKTEYARLVAEWRHGLP